MTVLTFPSSPTVGQQYAAPNGIQYVFDGVKWIVETTSSSSEAVSNSTQDRVAPMFVDGDNTGITFSYNAATNTMSAEVTSVNGDRLVNGVKEAVLSAGGLLTVPGDIVFSGGILGAVEQGVGIGLWGDDPTITTPGGSIYLQGGMSSAETGGPTTRGGNVIISAGQGSNEVVASVGGNIEIYSGAAATTAGNIRIEGGGTYGSSGHGGDILIQSGSSISGVAGNIDIQSGVGSGGGGLFEGTLKLRGSTVDISSASDSIKIKTGDVDFNDPAGPFVWEFDNLGNLTLPVGGALVYPNGALQRDTAPVTGLGNVSTVVYTASGVGIHTIRLLIQVEGFVGANTFFDTQACEMIIAKSFRANALAASVYGVVHTSVAPLATFTANWNTLTSRVEVICTTPSANTVNVKIFATEITTSD